MVFAAEWILSIKNRPAENSPHLHPPSLPPDQASHSASNMPQFGLECPRYHPVQWLLRPFISSQEGAHNNSIKPWRRRHSTRRRTGCRMGVSPIAIVATRRFNGVLATGYRRRGIFRKLDRFVFFFGGQSLFLASIIVERCLDVFSDSK